MNQSNGTLRGGSWIDAYLNGIDGSPENTVTEYPFHLRIGILDKNVTPRDPRFEIVIDAGANFIENILFHRTLGFREGAEVNLAFVFPERHMSPTEQRAFLTRLKRHPEVAMIKSVDIITQNPFIAMSGDRKNMAIIEVCTTERTTGWLPEDKTVADIF